LSCSEQSIEFKDENISAVLIDLGFPCFSGCKPRSSYQGILCSVVSELLISDGQLLHVVAVDAGRPIVLSKVSNILGVISTPPVLHPRERHDEMQCLAAKWASISVNDLMREAGD
jgi:hypothetical protein